jgi:hypothetical protein
VINAAKLPIDQVDEIKGWNETITAELARRHGNAVIAEPETKENCEKEAGTVRTGTERPTGRYMHEKKIIPINGPQKSTTTRVSFEEYLAGRTAAHGIQGKTTRNRIRFSDTSR